MKLVTHRLRFLLAIGVVLMAGCGEERAARPTASAEEFPDQQVSDFALTETYEGKPEWKLYARVASTYNSRSLVVAEGVRIDFFDDEGKKSSELTAREGELYERTRNMVARGNVILRTTEGMRLTTEELRYINKTDKIVVPSDQLVRVEQSGDVLTGYGFESDPELRHFEFKRAVRATVRTRSGGTIGGTEDKR